MCHTRVLFLYKGEDAVFGMIGVALILTLEFYELYILGSSSIYN